MSYPNIKFNFNANNVLGMLVAGGILFMFVHLVNPVKDVYNTTAMGLIGVVLLFMGVALWLFKLYLDHGR